MSEDRLNTLLERMGEIAKAVNSFSSEAVQIAAFHALISTFKGTMGGSNSPEEADAVSDEKAERSPRRRTNRRGRPNGESRSTGLDEQAVVNSMKEDARFDRFRKKIVLGNANKEQQVKFVSWFVGETPITSGNMMRVLGQLGVRMSAPQASMAVSSSKSDYIETPGSKPSTFKLSGRAHQEYEAWLLDASSSS